MADLPKGVTGATALLNLIAAHTSPARPSEHFTAGSPEVLAGDASFNSRVLGTPTVYSKLVGSMNFRYNRVQLNKLPLTATSFNIGGATAVSGLLTAINNQTGMVITMDDLEEASIPAGATLFTITAKSTSRFFIPGTTLQLGKPNVVDGPASFLLDVDTLVDRLGSAPLITSTGTTVDNAVLLNGRPSRSIPASRSLRIDLGGVFDLSLPEWTLEFTLKVDNSVSNAYAAILALTNSGSYPGLLLQQGNNGFGNRWLPNYNPGALNTHYPLPFGSAAKVGNEVKIAIVRTENLMKWYIDGTYTKLANGTGSSYTYDLPVPAGSPAGINRLVIGGGTLAFHVGSIRFSRFCRYFGNYTPADF